MNRNLAEKRVLIAALESKTGVSFKTPIPEMYHRPGTAEGTLLFPSLHHVIS